MATKTDLGDLLSFGVDVIKRRLYFGDSLSVSDEDIGSFSQRSVELAVRSLHKLAADAPGKPIELYMSSGGGDAYEMLRLYDEILSSPCQIKFYGGGIIMSAATWIMAACDERYLYPNTTVMVHDARKGYDGTYKDIRVDVREMERLQEKLYDIYALNSRMPREFWADVCSRDLHLTAEEAITLGLADFIVQPKKRGNLRRARQAALKKPQPTDRVQKLVDDLYARVHKRTAPKLELNKPVKEPEDPDVVVVETTETASSHPE